MMDTANETNGNGSELEKLEPTPETELDELLEKYKRELDCDVVGWVSNRFGPLIFREANYEQLNAFTKKVQKEELMAGCMNLSIECAVHPPRKQMASLLQRKPGLATKAATLIQDISGDDAEARAKKD